MERIQRPMGDLVSEPVQSFESLLERHERPVYAFVLSRSGNRELAQELAQEVFVRAYEGFSRFDQRQPFLRWILGIAHHVTAERQRSEERRLRALQTAASVNQWEGVHWPEERQPEAEARARPLAEQVLAAIRDCPESYRLPLTLRYLDQLSYLEIAQTLDLDLTQIKGILYRGKKLLQARLSRLWKDDPGGAGS